MKTESNTKPPAGTQSLESYRAIAPSGTVDLILNLADSLKGTSMLHVNSTRYGGGVAEMLLRLVPLLENVGIHTRWEVIQGSNLFYKTTKSFHNALQGHMEVITRDMFEEYSRINKEQMNLIDLESNVVIIHDPQPAALIHKKKDSDKWIWRCHIDVANPMRKVWQFLRNYVNQYDAAIFSLPGFAQKLAIPQFLIYPSIDPLSDKNKDLSTEFINKTLDKYTIPHDRPIILQVSRFDKFKDPLGVVEAYRLAKKYNDCVLVLAGGAAADDPEGMEVLGRVQEEASKDKNIFILNLPPDANLEINALQRAATVILQKSTKEGFGLTVAEAMWKGKPVVGGAVGGIAVQIVYGKTGFTVNSIEGCAYRIRYLLNNPEETLIIGKSAKEYTRRNFLITRHIMDYLALMKTLRNN
jgi:trehalose synthase